jgi:hypothetical protein
MNAHSTIVKIVFGSLMLLVMMLAPVWGWGQTPYVMSGGDYTESFTNIANTTNWPNGFNGTDSQEWSPVAVNASGTLGDGVKTTVSTATFTSGSSGGVQRGSTNIYMLSTSTSNACAIDLLLNFTGRNAGTISFDVATVFNSTGDRDSKLKLFYSINGTTFTEITGTNLPYTARNNVPGSASITTISLPSAFNNSSTARLRFYEYSTNTGATPTGSQPKISIDNIAVTSTIGNSASSDIIANTSFSYPSNIAYGSYQGTAPLTTGNSIEVAQFDIRDGGGTSDADAVSTTLTGIAFNVANSGSLRRIALFDGTTNVGEVAGGSTATFSSLTLSAADNSIKTFSVRVSFLSGVTDNQQFSFTISSATASGSGSGFAAGNAGGAVSSTTGDINRIEVTASDIIFVQGVSTVALGAVMSPSPTLRAIDANTNNDLDYGETWSAAVTAGTVTFDGTATTTGSFSSGLATLGNLKFNSAGTGNKITVTSGSFADESGSFEVTNPLPEINIKQAATDYLTGSTYGFGN